MTLLRISSLLDRGTHAVAAIARWALLANALLIAGNALMRKFFSIAEPALYDLQWHFFAVVVMLMAAYTLQRDEHVRIDVLSQWLGERRLAWLDLAGFFLVLLPICIVAVWFTFPHFMHAFLTGGTRASRESTSALPAWIILGLVPAGFVLLGLQAVSEGIRRLLFLRGCDVEPVNREPLLPS